MKNYALILIFTLVAVAAIGAEAINETAKFPANGRLEVANVAGSVTIEGWSQQKIEVSGRLGDDSTLIFDVEGDTARIEIELDKDRKKKKSWDFDASDLVIRVPYSTRVSATTVSADLTVKEIKGSQRLQTVSGNLKASVYDDEADVRSVSGDIVVKGDGSRLDLAVGSVSGDIDVMDVAGEIAANTVSGDIEIAAGEVSRLKMGSVSGDALFSGKLQTGGRIDADSTSGDVELNLASLSNTEYSLKSFSGDIDSVLNQEPARTSKYAPGRKLQMTDGAGDSRVWVNTMSGDIKITDRN